MIKKVVVKCDGNCLVCDYYEKWRKKCCVKLFFPAGLGTRIEVES